MTTTSQFQKKPDYYLTKEECINSYRNKVNTNPRYKHFCQTHYTAGDEQQFEEFRYANPENEPEIDIDLTSNIFCNHDVTSLSHLYSDINASNVIETFRYIFYKFKKGIFVKIVDNKLAVFLPFSNANFVNEWSHNINDTEIDFLKRYGDVKSVNSFKHNWYANNCLLRYEYPVNEGDTNVCNIKNMLEELCSCRQVPNIEFFINRRDYPILNANLNEPYYDLWNSKTTPLVSHKYEKYIPIMSMSSSNEYADILIPTHEDWARIQDGLWFPKSFRGIVGDSVSQKSWDRKIKIAVFRGSSTGSGITVETNQRLKVSYMSSLSEKDPEDGLCYLDAGIHKWNLRPKKVMGSSKLQIIDTSKIGFNLVSPLTFEEQCKYKYIIHIDGHVSAFRLSTELSMNSVILKVESPWKLWFSDMLIPYKHYIPIKSDLSDLIEKIQWCKKHDEMCKEIASNALLFYNTYLCKNSELDYLQKILYDVKSHTRGNNYYYFLNEEEYFNIQQPSSSPSSYDLEPTLNILEYSEGRCYGYLKAIRLLMEDCGSKLMKSYIQLTEQSDVFKNSSINVRKGRFLNFPIILKSSTNKGKRKENIHEASIGLKCVNKLLKEIPNFVYTFKLCDDDNDREDECNIISEFIDGQTLYEYVNSSKFNIQEYINILIQVCLVLQHSQLSYYLVHNDLTPWNIVLQSLPSPLTIDYIVSSNEVISIKTSLIPIILDYGKCHVIESHKHQGGNFSTIQDLLTLLITSLYQIIVTKNLDTKEMDIVLQIANFISEGEFHPKKFMSLRELKTFLFYAKKHSFLLYTPKGSLEDINPIDFLNKFKHLCNLKIGRKTTFISSMDRQWFKIIYDKITKGGQENISHYLQMIPITCDNHFDLVKSLHILNLISNEFIQTEETQKLLEKTLHQLISFDNLFILSRHCEDCDCDDNNDIYLKNEIYILYSLSRLSAIPEVNVDVLNDLKTQLDYIKLKVSPYFKHLKVDMNIDRESYLKLHKEYNNLSLFYTIKEAWNQVKDRRCVL